MEDQRTRFETEVLPYLDTAYRFALWLSRSRADAEDVVQEAMLRAYRGFAGLRGADAKSWLLSIVRHCHATARTRQLRHQTRWLDPYLSQPLSSGDAPDPEKEAVRADDSRALAQLVWRLPQEQREVLMLREIEELSYRDIAEVTGTPIGTLMSRLARARTALKHQWQQEQRGERHALR